MSNLQGLAQTGGYITSLKSSTESGSYIWPDIDLSQLDNSNKEPKGNFPIKNTSISNNATPADNLPIKIKNTSISNNVTDKDPQKLINDIYKNNIGYMNGNDISNACEYIRKIVCFVNHVAINANTTLSNVDEYNNLKNCVKNHREGIVHHIDTYIANEKFIVQKYFLKGLMQLVEQMVKEIENFNLDGFTYDDTKSPVEILANNFEKSNLKGDFEKKYTDIYGVYGGLKSDYRPNPSELPTGLNH